ncbi:MAG: hypothetical protein AAGG01_13815, partial [Planctomycetota bacterium]
QLTNTGPNTFTEVRIPTDLVPGNPGTVPTASATFYFQFWHRDLIMGFPQSQLTEATSLTFE